MDDPRVEDLDKSGDQFVAEMRQLIVGGSSNPAVNTSTAMRALHKFACVLTVLSKAADKQTRRIIWLTWALLVFTAALFSFTVFLYKDTHALVKHEQAAKPHIA